MKSAFSNEKLKSLPEAIRQDAKVALETPKEKRDEVQKYLFTKFGAALKVTDAEVRKSFSEADKATAAKLESADSNLERVPAKTG